MNIFCHCCRESQREACRQASFCCCCCKPAGIAAWAWCRWGEPGKPRRRRRGGDKGGWPGSGRWRWWFWCQKRWLREFGANKLPLTLEIAQLQTISCAAVLQTWFGPCEKHSKAAVDWWVWCIPNAAVTIISAPLQCVYSFFFSPKDAQITWPIITKGFWLRPQI